MARLQSTQHQGGWGTRQDGALRGLWDKRRWGGSPPTGVKQDVGASLGCVLWKGGGGEFGEWMGGEEGG